MSVNKNIYTTSNKFYKKTAFRYINILLLLKSYFLYNLVYTLCMQKLYADQQTESSTFFIKLDFLKPLLLNKIPFLKRSEIKKLENIPVYIPSINSLDNNLNEIPLFDVLKQKVSNLLQPYCECYCIDFKKLLETKIKEYVTKKVYHHFNKLVSLNVYNEIYERLVLNELDLLILNAILTFNITKPLNKNKTSFLYNLPIALKSKKLEIILLIIKEGHKEQIVSSNSNTPLKNYENGSYLFYNLLLNLSKAITKDITNLVHEQKREEILTHTEDNYKLTKLSLKYTTSHKYNQPSLDKFIKEDKNNFLKCFFCGTYIA
jgi:hypothetical protein